MKKIIGAVVIIAAVMLLMPLTVMKSQPQSVSAMVAAGVPKAKEALSDSFRVCQAETGEITEMKAEEYIFGVVAAEMPALYDQEALKAQAVAAYTFACCRKAENSGKSYDITTDYNSDQSFITQQAAREKWGEKADEYTQKIKKAVEDVEWYMITYNGSPITAVYHAISSGKTEDSLDVWNEDAPYLKPVLSEGDKLSPDYITEASFTAEELKTKFGDEIEFLGDTASYFGECSRTASGAVKEISVCTEKLTGARVRSLLDLRSANFQVKYAEGKFEFTVYGYGHGVGMSQYGANYMAKQGSDFKEILTHYYTGCKVEKIAR